MSVDTTWPHPGSTPAVSGMERKRLPYIARVALGEWPDMTTVAKFGGNAVVGATEEDIWSYGGEETLMTTAAVCYVSCADNTNGVGQEIHVTGLDENWDRITGHAILNGYTQVPIEDADGNNITFFRIFRAYQSSAAPDPVGDVYIAELDATIALGVPQDATKVHALIDYTDAAQQTQKAMYTIPRNYVGMIFETQAFMKAATGSARSVEIGIEISELADGATVDNPSWAPRRRVEEYSISTSGPTVEHKMFSPIVVGPLTDIHMRGKSTADSDVLGSFEFILVPVEGAFG